MLQDQFKLYMVLEYVAGGDFFTFLNDRDRGRHVRRPLLHRPDPCMQEGHGRTVLEEDARVYTAELTLALGHLHSLTIAFRDLKPEK